MSEGKPAGEIHVLRLRKPITVHGQAGPNELKELQVKLPPAELLWRLGEPYTIKSESAAGIDRFELKVIAPVAAEFFAAMTGVDQLLLNQMHPRDVIDAMDMIVKILRPMPA